MQVKHIQQKRFQALTHALCCQPVRIQNMLPAFQEAQSSFQRHHCSNTSITILALFHYSIGNVLSAEQPSLFFTGDKV